MTETPRPDDEEFTEEPRGAGRLIARFFLLPLLVVVAAVGIFLVFNLMTFERRSPRDYLQEVRGGAANRRWQAAFELSRSLGNLPPEERASLTAETLRIFEIAHAEAAGRRPGAPLPRARAGPAGRARTAVPALLAAAAGSRSRHAALRDLGAREDRRPGRLRHGAGGVPVRGRGRPQDGGLRPGPAGRPAGDPAAEGARRGPRRGRALERRDRARGARATRRACRCCAR